MTVHKKKKAAPETDRQRGVENSRYTGNKLGYAEAIAILLENMSTL